MLTLTLLCDPIDRLKVAEEWIKLDTVSSEEYIVKRVEDRYNGAGEETVERLKGSVKWACEEWHLRWKTHIPYIKGHVVSECFSTELKQEVEDGGSGSDMF